MTAQEILAIPAMPATSPTYPMGPYRFINREFFIVNYLTDPEVIRRALPEPLEPTDKPIIAYEWIRMPDSAGFGDYTETGIVIPCRFKGEEVNFTTQMYLNDLSPIVAGREIWGFPKEYADVILKVNTDTLTGTMDYAGERVAMGTMCYKQRMLDHEATAKGLTKTAINLKLIPDVDGKPAIAQLVAYNLMEINLKGAWEGDARLHLIPHVNANVADFPVRQIIGGRHIIADLTLPYGRVVHDYLKA